MYNIYIYIIYEQHDITMENDLSVLAVNHSINFYCSVNSYEGSRWGESHGVVSAPHHKRKRTTCGNRLVDNVEPASRG